jgi:hypothetical protein
MRTCVNGDEQLPQTGLLGLMTERECGFAAQEREFSEPQNPAIRLMAVEWALGSSSRTTHAIAVPPMLPESER